jgi:hypothetical protein
LNSILYRIFISFWDEKSIRNRVREDIEILSIFYPKTGKRNQLKISLGRIQFNIGFLSAEGDLKSIKNEFGAISREVRDIPSITSSGDSDKNSNSFRIRGELPW